MTRLIVDDAGTRRAFKLAEGRLTVGSGPGVTLRLTAADVAEVHCELELVAGKLRLRPSPGVLPPLVGGVPARGEAELAHGVPLQIGAATLTVQYDEPHPAPAATPRSSPARERSRGPGGRRSGTGAARAPAAGVTRRAPRESAGRRGLPGWALVLILVAVAALALALVPRLLTSTPPGDLGLKASLRVAREALAAGNLPQARQRVDGVQPERLDAEGRVEYEAVLAAVEAAEAENRLEMENRRGTEYLNTQLQKFETNYLRGEAQRPQARVFLKRCKEFKQRWPQHPQLDWVERMEARFAPIADLDAPSTYSDVAFEAEALTWANPRDYEQAFALVRGFADERAGPDDRAKALALIDEMSEKRRAWFDDRMQQARWEFERGQEGQSVAWLVMLIVYSGDEDMADQAASELVKFEGLKGWLEAYGREQPDRYATLRRNSVIAEFIREHKLQ